MSRLKYENPFAMGNLEDLMYARENDDVEYLKEWSKKAVETHGRARDIQLKAYAKLITISNDSTNAVQEIRQMLKES